MFLASCNPSRTFVPIAALLLLLGFPLPVRAQTITPDLYEPDGTMGQATTLATPFSTQRRSLHTAADVDWVKFTVPTACSAIISTDGPEGDTVMELWATKDDGSGLLWKVSGVWNLDDRDSNKFARIDCQYQYHWSEGFIYPLGTGLTYYVKVAVKPGTAPIANYTLSIDLYEGPGYFESTYSRPLHIPHQWDDENWTPSQYRQLGYWLAGAGDVDWNRFTLDRPSSVKLTLTGNVSGYAAMELYLLGCSAPIAVSDSRQCIERTGASALLPGCYYVKIFSTQLEHRRVIYDVSLVITDVYEPDDTMANAAPLTLNVPQQHHVTNGYSVDYARFALDQRSDVTIVITSDAQHPRRPQHTCSLLDAAGNPVAGGTVTTGTKWQISFTGGNALPAGTYYVRLYGEGYLRPDDNDPSSPYVWKIHEDAYSVTVMAERSASDAAEPDDEAVFAQSITPGMPQAHTLHSAQDVDWVTFALDRTSIVELQTSVGANHTTLSLFGPDDATRLIADGHTRDGGGQAVTLLGAGALKPGVYYARVSAGAGWSSAATGYTLTLGVAPHLRATVQTDRYEPDNTADAARVLGEADPQVHTLNDAADVDWAKFTLYTQSSVYLWTDGLGCDTILTLYGPNSSTQVLAVDDNSGGYGLSCIILPKVAAGVYYVRISAGRGVRTVADDFTLMLQTWSPLTPTFAITPGPVVTEGTEVGLQASGVRATGAQYRFYARNTTRTGAPAVLIRDWAAASSHAAWKPAAGTWSVVVEMRSAGMITPIRLTSSLTVQPALSRATIAAEPLQRGAVGRRVRFGATHTGGVGTVLYRFMVEDAAGQVVYTRDYTDRDHTWWYPEAPGAYTATVTARDSVVGNTVSASMPYTVVPAMSALTIVATPSSPGLVGERIVLNVALTGGAHPLYRYVIGYKPSPQTPDSAIVWDRTMSYRTYAHTWLTPDKPGLYYIRAYAKESDSTSAYDVASSVTPAGDFVYTVAPPLASFTVGFSPSGSGLVGQPTTITATPVGGARLLWQFRLRGPGDSGYAIIRDYASPNSAVFTPDRPGVWRCIVYVRTASSTANYDQALQVTYPVQQ